MSYNTVCVFPQFPRCRFILLASTLYLLPLPKTLALTFSKHYLILSCWALTFPKTSISDVKSLGLSRNPGALEFSWAKLFLLILKTIRPYTANTPLKCNKEIICFNRFNNWSRKVCQSCFKTRNMCQAFNYLAVGNISPPIILGWVALASPPSEILWLIHGFRIHENIILSRNPD